MCQIRCFLLQELRHSRHAVLYDAKIGCGELQAVFKGIVGLVSHSGRMIAIDEQETRTLNTGNELLDLSV